MKKALMYASVASMIQQFNMDNIRLLMDGGYQVDVACNMKEGSTISAERIQAMEQTLREMGCGVYHIPVPRKITALGAIFQSFRLSKQRMNEGAYDLIHCHSPIGGMICRLANRCSRHYAKTKMIYTAHGFHFYQGAPRKNWLLYYPMERFCGRFTDTLITINREDHALAERKFRLKKGGKVAYVPGIGIDPDKIDHVALQPIRQELHIPEGDFLMLSVGELNDNKNHALVLRAMKELPETVHYAICGQGPNASALKGLAEELGLGERLHLLGYRSDVPGIVKACDLFVFPSKREGLSVALMEAMACRRAVACSGIRGNTDLIDPAGGALFDPADVDSCARAIGGLLDRDRAALGAHNWEKVLGFSREKVGAMMRDIYGLRE